MTGKIGAVYSMRRILEAGIRRELANGLAELPLMRSGFSEYQSRDDEK